MFAVDMLPAGHGDCLWIEYGDSTAPLRILIDGGTAPTHKALRDRIMRLNENFRRFELLVVTHIDGDHIEGALSLLRDETLGVEFGDVWFNGWQHLPGDLDDSLGAVQGESVSAVLKERRLGWNCAFEGKSVAVPELGALPVVQLAGGLELVLLSPTVDQLAKLRPCWEREVRKAGLIPGSERDALELLRSGKKHPPDELGESVLSIQSLANSEFIPDKSQANGSSIAFLIRYEDLTSLFAADAHAAVLQASAHRLMEQEGRDALPLEVFKMPHHGSQANNSADLFSLMPAKHYLVSTSGRIFGHPDPEAIARAIVHGGKKPHFHFNYRSEENEVWKDKRMRDRFRYEVDYPDGDDGLRVTL